MFCRTERRFNNWLALAILFITLTTGSPLIARDDNARLPEPRYPEITNLRYAGEYLKAMVKVDDLIASRKESVAIELLVLKATLFSDLGNHEESILYWNRVAARSKSLSGHAARKAVQLRLLLHDPFNAETALKKVPGGLSSRDNISFILAVADEYLAKGQHKLAENLYRQVMRLTSRTYNADKARYGLASSQSIAGNYKNALANLRSLQVDFRDPEMFQNGRALDQSIARLTGKASSHFSEDEYLRIVRRLKGRSRYSQALEIIDEWRSQYPRSRKADQIDAENIDVLYRMRANEEALSDCLNFYQLHPKSSLISNIRFKELLLYQRTGNTAKVEELGSDIWKGKHGGKTALKRSAGLLLGSYLVSHGEVADGLEYYRQVYKSGPGSNTKNDILWRVGVGAFRDGQLQRSVNNLVTLLKRKPKGELLPAAIYWLGVSHAGLENYKESLRQLLRLEQQFPNHYYGIRSPVLIRELSAKVEKNWLDKTRESFKLKVLSFPDVLLPTSAVKQASYKVASVLARAGLAEEAAPYIVMLQRSYRGDRSVALLTARTLASAGNYERSVRYVYDYFHAYLQRPAENLPEDFWQLYFPRPFWDEIRKAAKDHNIEPELMVSLMRQESRFNPNARSQVGAIGLFQIMPYTAEELGPKIGLGSIKERDLYSPEINATIAAHLASNLLRYFKDHPAPTIASYNAGEDRVMAWWQAAVKENLQEDLFIDTIPYRETRSFVRQVLTNYYAYYRIYHNVDLTAE